MVHKLIAEALAEVPSLRWQSKYSRPVLVPTGSAPDNVLALASKGVREIRLFPHNGTTLVSRLISGEPAPNDFGPAGTFRDAKLKKAVAELISLEKPPRQISIEQQPDGYAISVDYSAC